MNIVQKQCLLKYLGYYDGAIDGAWGAKSANATKEFQKDNGLTADGVFGSKTEEVIVTAVFHGKFKTAASTNVSTKTESGDWWDNIKHFDRSEFKCKCGKYCNGYPVEPQEQLVTVADRVREHFGKAVHVSSGVRCNQHNANVGGVSNSRHKSGKAMDFRVIGYTAQQVLAYVQKQPEIRYSYSIDGTYVHMDIN